MTRTYASFENHLQVVHNITEPWPLGLRFSIDIEIEIVVRNVHRKYELKISLESPLLPFFNHALQNVREAGLLRQLNHKWKKSAKVHCGVGRITDFSAITVKKITLLLSIVAVGVIMGLVLLLIEKLMIVHKNMTENKI